MNATDFNALVAYINHSEETRLVHEIVLRCFSQEEVRRVQLELMERGYEVTVERLAVGVNQMANLYVRRTRG